MIRTIVSLVLSFSLAYGAALADDAAGPAQTDDANAGTAKYDPNDVAGPLASTTYTTKGHRKPGQPVVNANGQKTIWPHKMPLFGQAVLDRGYHFPDPYGVSLIATYLDQDLLLDNLGISTDGGITEEAVEFVQFDGVYAVDVALEAKLDVWVVPFMNVFAIAGLVDGRGHIPFGIQVDGLLEQFGIDLCDRRIRPAFCDDVIKVEVDVEYTGYNYGLGAVFAGGWKGFFVALPLTWVHSELDITNSTIDTFEAEPIFGHIFKLSKKRSFEVFIGGSYLDAEYTGTGSIPIPLSEIDSSLEDKTLDYRIDEKNKDPWNMVLGGQFQGGEHWDLEAQVGFLGSRTQYTLVGVFRW